MFEILGAVLGGLLGLVGPFLFVVIYTPIYVRRGGDPTALGGLFIVTFITAPAGIVLGAAMGFVLRLWVKRSKR